MKSISINLTIHNKAAILLEVLLRIKNNTPLPYELVMVLDGCTDNSADIVQRFCDHYPQIKTKVLVADNVFETKANNMAAKASSGDYIIIVQDDMLINADGWARRLIRPLKTFSDVFAVTAGTAHNWTLNKDSYGYHNPAVIRNNAWNDLLDHVHHANAKNTPYHKFAIRDCVNRGPLAINRLDLETMGYFDEAFSPQDSDDHDLCYRMHKKLGKVVGFYSIDWFSKPEYGGTRDANGLTKPWAYETQNKNVKLLYDRHQDYMNTHQQEERELI